MSTATDVLGGRVWAPDEIGEAIGEDDDWRRYEILDGVLIVSPPAMPQHNALAFDLAAALGAAVPTDYRAMGSVGVDLGRSYRITDATVVTRAFLRRGVGLATPADVLLAIEVESPSSITTDRVTKPAQYAAAGIEHYWRVEMDPLRLHTYRLASDVYKQTGEWGANEIARITDPFAVEIDLSTLLP